MTSTRRANRAASAAAAFLTIVGTGAIAPLGRQPVPASGPAPSASSASPAPSAARAVPIAAQPAGRGRAPAPQVPPSVQRLRRDIDDIVSAPVLAAGTWGIAVRSLSRGEPLYARNAEKLLVPSSNMKILTLAAAAERLGWDYTYETRLIAAGPIAGGVLDGDLIVVGSGDPSIDDWDGRATELFRDWASQLETAGVRTISGRVVGDDNAFEEEGFGAGWSWDDLDRSYAASVGALQFNENTAQLTVKPGAAPGDEAVVSAAPDGAGLIVRNLVKTAARGSRTTLATERRPGGTALEIRGTIAVGAAPIVRNVSVVNPTLYFVNELRTALAADGIDVRGAAVDIDDLTAAPARAEGPPLVAYRSPPLSELASTMMRLSQNLYAETLLKTLGLSAGAPNDAGGIAEIRRVMDEWNIPSLGYVEADGSGLSRSNLATADTIVSVLAHVDGDRRLRDLFRATLPIAGRSGTLEGRMRGTPAVGNARAKTGSLTNARALSGYVSSAEGEPLAFAILANNFGIPPERVDEAADAIVARLASFSRK